MGNLPVTGVCGHLIGAKEETDFDGASERDDENQTGLTGPVQWIGPVPRHPDFQGLHPDPESVPNTVSPIETMRLIIVVVGQFSGQFHEIILSLKNVTVHQECAGELD